MSFETLAMHLKFHWEAMSPPATTNCIVYILFTIMFHEIDYVYLCLYIMVKRIRRFLSFLLSPFYSSLHQNWHFLHVCERVISRFISCLTSFVNKQDHVLGARWAFNRLYSHLYGFLSLSVRHCTLSLILTT